jgi:hypothetical protein
MEAQKFTKDELLGFIARAHRNTYAAPHEITYSLQFKKLSQFIHQLGKSRMCLPNFSVSVSFCCVNFIELAKTAL